MDRPQADGSSALPVRSKIEESTTAKKPTKKEDTADMEGWLTPGKAKGFFGSTKPVRKKPKSQQGTAKNIDPVKQSCQKSQASTAEGGGDSQTGHEGEAMLAPNFTPKNVANDIESIARSAPKAESLSEAYQMLSAETGIPMDEIKDHVSVSAFMNPKSMKYLGPSETYNIEEKLDPKTSGSPMPLNLATSFTYSPLPNGKFRLLSIFPGTSPVVTMDDYSLDNPPKYVAMSYAWGKERTERAFFCNYRSFAISAHVQSALNNLSLALDRLNKVKPEENQARLVWIDALCINQEDETERAIQVAKMQTIYSRASQVPVWLGPAENDSDMLIEKLDELGAFAENVVLKKAPYPKANSPFPESLWHALGSFICRPWFNRIWVVQELLLGEEPILVCGSKVVEWEKFVDVVGLAWEAGFLSLVKASTASPHDLGTSARNITTLAGSKRKFDPSQGFPTREFIGTLNTGRYRQVTEPVDRVWAYLGLAEPKLREAAASLIDYSPKARREYHTAYANLGKLLLPKEHGSYLLSIGKGQSGHAGFPSWCPNFHSVPALGHNVLFLNGKFEAGIQANRSQVCSVNFQENSDILEIKGFQIDRVQEVVQDSQVGRPHSEWLLKCLELSKKTVNPHDKNGTPDAHWRCMTVDTYDTATAPSLAKEVFWLFEKHLHQEPNIPPVRPEVQDSLRHLMKTMKNNDSRSYFSTKRGRLGRGPPGIQPGDRICIFYGAKVPYVLRLGGPGSPAKLIADTYVDGIMYGEALKVDDRGDDEIFRID
ncbi:hypothetical protein FQN54_002498 [Arachnomyces sp. PD_36]|nr:hypothetical protein FQN54_002498 [Arachnomyces sp. PD_36]